MLQLDFFVLLAGLAFIFTVIQVRPDLRTGLRVFFHVIIAMLVYDRACLQCEVVVVNPSPTKPAVSSRFQPSQAAINIVRELNGLGYTGLRSGRSLSSAERTSVLAKRSRTVTGIDSVASVPD